MLHGWWRDAAWSEKSDKKAKDKTNNKTKEVSKYCALIHWSLLMDDWLFWLTGSWRIRISCRSDCCRCISHFYKSAFMGLSRDIWEPIQPSAAKRKSNRCLTMVITITVIGANWHHIIIIFCLVNGRHDYFSCANYSPMWRCYQLWATVILNIMNLLLSLYYYYSHFSLGLKRKNDPNLSAVKGTSLFSLPLFEPRLKIHRAPHSSSLSSSYRLRPPQFYFLDIRGTGLRSRLSHPSSN